MGRRRRGEEEHDNHERWMVSYADFITLLFAFFVVMYSLSSINEGKYRILSDSLMQAFRSGALLEGSKHITEPAVISGSMLPPIVRRSPERVETEADTAAAVRLREMARRMNSMADEIRRVLGPLTRNGQVTVTEGAFGIRVEINASVLFAPAEATLGSEAVAALQAVARVLAPATFPVTVEGHTDNLPINNFRFPSNWELSAVRASSVVRLFVEAGVDPDRLTAAGYADQRPVAPNGDEQGRARNRRVTILIESMLAEPPPGDMPGRIRPGDPIRSILPEESAAEPG
ncbi:flagellar motor protein MotD [Pseudothauera rhizosphaerae]|uniref:Flagellar motor protein MotD n=1 Tax=Pseudothauera rhizosphaerae TaxID=2565932 RepID=A0A4S4B006_9RHOO|nr:flagellar motor protein MotD [Pseudothauera rhizosphaerae]THF64195.1 flagellar motor protein MotD [Pseudothauera rhizosphaerae]